MFQVTTNGFTVPVIMPLMSGQPLSIVVALPIVTSGHSHYVDDVTRLVAAIHVARLVILAAEHTVVVRAAAVVRVVRACMRIDRAHVRVDEVLFAHARAATQERAQRLAANCNVNQHQCLAIGIYKGLDVGP